MPVEDSLLMMPVPAAGSGGLGLSASSLISASDSSVVAGEGEELLPADAAEARALSLTFPGWEAMLAQVSLAHAWSCGCCWAGHSSVE